MKYLYVLIISLFIFSAFGQSSPSDTPCSGTSPVPCYRKPCSGQSNGLIQLNNVNSNFSYSLINTVSMITIGTLSGNDDVWWDGLPTGSYKIRINEVSCSRDTETVTLSYKDAVSLGSLTGSDICSSTTSRGTITLSGYQSGVRYFLKDKDNPTLRYYNYNTVNGTLRWTVPAGKYEVVAGYLYEHDFCPGSSTQRRLMANSSGSESPYNCSATSNTAEVKNLISSQPSTTITVSGCETLSLTCSPSNAGWYWQTSSSGTSTSYPSTTAFSVSANTTWYLRANNGSCWSPALSYTPSSRIPPQPVTTITTTGCETLSLTCSPSNAGWYWQTSSSGTSTSYPSTTTFSVSANTTYYLRAHNGGCWSPALSYTPSSRTAPPQPVTTITTTGCETLSLTCSPSNAGWYWQTSSGGTTTSYPSATAFSVSANTTYYLRANNGSCWSPALSYTPSSRIPPQPVTTITTTGCETLSLTCSPSNAGWYWQTSSSGTSTSYPSTTTFSVSANTTYYLRAHNGGCWSPALSYTPSSRTAPPQPVTTITTTGCETLSLTCSPSNAGWYWQTSSGGTTTSYPSATAFTVSANTTYYLRAYNGGCWSSALSYTPSSRIPSQPVTTITTTGCETLSLTCSPSNAGWYWQTSSSGTTTSYPSTTAFSVSANTTYYLRAHNGGCWSPALSYTPSSRTAPPQPVTTITTTGCETLSLTCSPSNAGWYWQTSSGGTSTGYPSTTAFSVSANITYYLRAHTGGCWSPALSYTPSSRIPSQPVTTITTTGCETLSLTCSPSNAGWYWQTSSGGTTTSYPSATAFSVSANTTYYLRAYNGNCWSLALSYTPSSRTAPPQPVTTITTTGCETLSLTCSPSNAGWYWQTSSGGTTTSYPSTTTFSVSANTTYYLRAHNGGCWSSALSYTPSSRIPPQPVTTITTTGCETLSLTCSPSNAGWYWQTSSSGTSTSYPSATAFSVSANTTYYLRAYSGNCWSPALSYTPSSRTAPPQPVTTITTTGCETLSLTCTPSNAGWYWQTSSSGTSTGYPSATAFSVSANTTYYLRAHNGGCWSPALSYTPSSRIPSQPVTTITTSGCETLSLTCSPSIAGGYWQTSSGGTSTGYPSGTAFSVSANTTYYLRAYNGNCWSPALSYTPSSRIPSQPVTTITTMGCATLSLMCIPYNAGWYWQTSSGGTSTSYPSATAFSVSANTTYYLRGYNGNCWGPALSYTPSSRTVPSQPVTTITTMGCATLSLMCIPYNAGWYWQTSSGGTSTSYPSATAFSVSANTTYYLRGYNGNCWGPALSYTPSSRTVPSQPVTTITTTGCATLSLTCSPSNTDWYWQTSSGGTSTGYPSATAFSVSANTTYYLRAYSGGCWGPALSYTPSSRTAPSQPVTTITTTGCAPLSLTCSPSNAGWYWQTSSGGTSTGYPSTTAFSVSANTTYYLRAYNGSCWSFALSYRSSSGILSQPVTTITTSGCETLSLTCNPSNAGWYWQTSSGGTSTSYSTITAFSVSANTTYYLRAYSGNCWSPALSYTPSPRMAPSQPVTTITTTGCAPLSLTCSLPNPSWYWQTSSAGTSTGYPSTTAFSVSANTTYYLRAYNGNCWGPALSYYTPEARQPPDQPSTTISAHGGCNRNYVLSCSPSNANWYWQTYSNGTSTEDSRKSTGGFTVTGSDTYYLRAYDAATQCWSTALEKIVVVTNRSGPAVAQLTGYDFCGSNSGKVVLLQSQTGLTYQLMAARGNIGTLAGTGSALEWTGLSAATYWVVATYPDEPRCETEMANRVSVNAIATSEATVNFDSKRFFCTTKFTPTVNLGLGSLGRVLSYRWEFGDTKTSTVESPVHAYSGDGTYTVTLTIRYTVDCSGRNLINCSCGGEFSRQVTKSITTNSASLPDSELFEPKPYTYEIPVYEKVLSSSATTFHSSWPYRNVMDNENPYTTGEDGIWRTSGSYVYKADRSQSADVTPATDGAYTMEQFSWEAPGISSRWLKTEQVREYSAYSKPLMVEDVLQVPASALYDYGGYLQSAQGVNMKNKEMAFTGFEYMDKYKGDNTAGRVSGNWNFGLSTVNVSIEYEANGSGNYIRVKTPSEKFENVNEIDVQVNSVQRIISFSNSPASTTGILQRLVYLYLYPYFSHKKIICWQASEDRKNTYLVVEHKVWPDNYHWEGNVIIPQTVRSFEAPDISVDKAHTGKSSLKITRDQTFPQEIIKLTSGRSYYLSAWVSASEITPSTAGIDVLFRDKDNVQAASFPCSPEGPVIEGWQQIRGTFICPRNDMKVALTFKQGGGPVYYDDLRLHPSEGNMESYVYDVRNYKLLAKLDAENFATLYFYDKEGQLRITKKETTDGVKTLSEMTDYIKVKN